jgi:thiosulfate/3-mercaptopyruvate sulfurtransferase
MPTLISAADLAKECPPTKNVGEQNWVVLDCRFDLANPSAGYHAYLEGHIPGAEYVDLDKHLSGKHYDEHGAFLGRHPLPDKSMFIAQLRQWGVSEGTQVVAYDAQGGMFAARCWWLLRWVGYEKVAVLDGGYNAWVTEGLDVTVETEARDAGNIQERTSRVKTVNVAQVLANLNTDRMTLVDARSPERFRGENETLDKVGGHIPGAKNRFFKDNLNEKGYFKSPEQLKKEWSPLISDPQQAVMQCGSGVTACHNLLALEIAGMPGAALYPGSWSEWCADPSRPVARGGP